MAQRNLTQTIFCKGDKIITEWGYEDTGAEAFTVEQSIAAARAMALQLIVAARSIDPAGSERKRLIDEATADLNAMLAGHG